MAKKKFFKPLPKAKPKPKKKLMLSPATIQAQWKKGVSGNPAGRPKMKSKTLMSRIKEMMSDRAIDPNTGYLRSRFDLVADSFLRQMEKGSFVHLKEYIDREEGKVPNRIADADGNNLKQYVIGLPVDDNDPNAP